MTVDPQHSVSQQTGGPPGEEFDPASQSLADALRRSFRVLKVLMLVLIVLYFLSGWFSVKPNERGIVVRFGKIVTDAGRPKVYEEGWWWSWPFPIDRWETISTKARELDLAFMLKLTDKEKATGEISKKFNPLSPERDDYVVTGDVNILHVNLKVKYQITDVTDYVTHLYPMPDPRATVNSVDYRRHPEYTVLRNLARDAVIETAASQAALDIRGSRQDAFLYQVASTLNRKLDALADRGMPLGIHVDENNGVIAPKSRNGTLEAIMPPRQVQDVFDNVFAAQTNKSVNITKARSEQQALLVYTAGPDYPLIVDAVDQEFDLLMKISALEAVHGRGSDNPELQGLRSKLKRQRDVTESLLADAAGLVRSIIKDAEVKRNQIIKDATGDYNRFKAVLPEYRRDPDIFLSRLKDETYARSLANDKVSKLYVPSELKQYRLKIPPDRKTGLEEEKEKQKRPGSLTDAPIKAL